MGQPFEHRDLPPDERAIRSLSDRTGVDVGHVRALFLYEFSRLRMGAKVGSYVAVLTAANVRGMLDRTTRLAEDRAAPRSDIAAEQQWNSAGDLARDGLRDTPSEARNLHRWEDDGGRPRPK